MREQIGKILQSIRYRTNRIISPIRNQVLMFTVPKLEIHNTAIVGKVKWNHTGGGSIRIGKNTVISDWVYILPYGGFIEIGENCSINAFCHINGNGGLKIGNNVRIAANSVIIPSNHRFDNPSIPIIDQGEIKKGIFIEDDVWIGAGTIILDGVMIGKGSVVGAGSVVTKSVPPMTVVAGVPATTIRQR